MRSYKSVVLVILILVVFCQSGCMTALQGKENGVNLLFSQLYEFNEQEKDVSSIIQALNGTTVSIRGFMAKQSPVDNSFVYLLNMPFIACPFCTINNTTKMEIISIYNENGRPVFYTESPVMVTGRLEVQQKTDEFGYTTQFRIFADKIDILKESDEDQVINTYYSQLSDTGVINALMGSYINIDRYLNPDLLLNEALTIDEKFEFLKEGIQPIFFEQGLEIMNSFYAEFSKLQPSDTRIKEYNEKFGILFLDSINNLNGLHTITMNKNNNLQPDNETMKQIVEAYANFIHKNNQDFENYISWNNFLWED